MDLVLIIPYFFPLLFLYYFCIQEFWHKLIPGAKVILITEGKIIIWLRLSVLHNKPNISYEAVQQNVKAAVELWQEQHSQGINNHDHPREGCALKGFLCAIKRNSANRLENLFLDPGIGSLFDGYSNEEHIKILIGFLRGMRDQVLCFDLLFF